MIPLEEYEAALALSGLYALRRELTAAVGADTNVNASIAKLMRRIELHLHPLTANQQHNPWHVHGEPEGPRRAPPTVPVELPPIALIRHGR